MGVLHIIRGPDEDVVPQADKALVTLTIGGDYFSHWQSIAQGLWQRYAERLGYDVVVVTAPMDLGPVAQARSPAWQKCLILSQPWSRRYQRIVWVDADILINTSAPDVCLGVPMDKVGASINGNQLSLGEKQIRLERTMPDTLPADLPPMHTLEEAARCWGLFHNHLYRQLEGIDTDLTRIVNTGVLVLSPGHHRTVLEAAYAFPQRTRGYEQHPLSYLLLKDDLLHELNPRFNWMLFEVMAVHFPRLLSEREEIPWPLVLELAQVEFYNAWFLHFAGLERIFRTIRSLTLHPPGGTS